MADSQGQRVLIRGYVVRCMKAGIRKLSANDKIPNYKHLARFMHCQANSQRACAARVMVVVPCVCVCVSVSLSVCLCLYQVLFPRYRLRCCL